MVFSGIRLQHRLAAAGCSSSNSSNNSRHQSRQQQPPAGNHQQAARVQCYVLCTQLLLAAGRQAGKRQTGQKVPEQKFCSQRKKLSERTVPSNPSLSSRPFLIVILKAAFRAYASHPSDG